MKNNIDDSVNLRSPSLKRSESGNEELCSELSIYTGNESCKTGELSPSPQGLTNDDEVGNVEHDVRARQSKVCDVERAGFHAPVHASNCLSTDEQLIVQGRTAYSIPPMTASLDAVFPPVDNSPSFKMFHVKHLSAIVKKWLKKTLTALQRHSSFFGVNEAIVNLILSILVPFAINSSILKEKQER